jgi:steroid delta-isomerase-like uncharacterized protein
MHSHVMRAVPAALEALDAESLLNLYSQDFLFEDIPSGIRITDKDSLREYFDSLFSLPEVGFSVSKVFEAHNFAVMEWIWSGERSGTKESYKIKGVSVFELREEKIVRESIYFDPRCSLPGKG